jgi:hypothetical protein
MPVGADNKSESAKTTNTTKIESNKPKTLIFDIDLNKRSTDSPSSTTSNSTSI